MEIGDGVELDDGLVEALIGCGRQGHRIAQAHHNDPGSNGFTFGTDRYQRSTELAIDVLRAEGFSTSRRGAGLIARRKGIELHFAVARGTDLTDPASFDADSSPARRKAGAANANQLILDGMPKGDAEPIIHVVWSGTPDAGQTAVHAGRLVIGAGDRLDWAILVRLDEAASDIQQEATKAVTVPAYVEQPEPILNLAARSDVAQSDEG